MMSRGISLIEIFVLSLANLGSELGCMHGRFAEAPRCRFASTEEGNILTEHEQWAKLRLIVEIAEEIWG